MGDAEFEIKNIQIGVVFSTFNWAIRFENTKEWRMATIDVGCFMISVGY